MKNPDIDIESAEIKIKKGNLYKDIQALLSDEDVTDFVVMAIRDSETSEGINLMTDRDKQFSPSTIIGLAHVVASLISAKVGFDSQAETDGKEMKQELIRTFAQIIVEFTCEILHSAVNDLTDDEELRKKLLHAIAKAKPETELLHSQIKAQECTEMYCNGECCEDCMNNACTKLTEAMEETMSDYDEKSSDGDTILEKFINNI